MSPLGPVIEFPWDAVLKVSGDADPFGLRMRLDFDLREPADIRGRLFPLLWGSTVRRPGFVFSEKNYRQALTVIPDQIPHPVL